VIEVAVVLDRERRPLHWHAPADATSVSLPDSRALWDVLWERRRDLCGVAHSHPGGGEPFPSREDLTTFAAVEAGLGLRLEWWITSADEARCFAWSGPTRYAYAGREPASERETEHWLAELRARSRPRRSS
jgi:hypothetical protein